MSRRELIDAGCTGKPGFLTWEQAKRSISRDRFRPNKEAGRGKLRVYRCRFCQHFHVGSASVERKDRST